VTVIPAGIGDSSEGARALDDHQLSQFRDGDPEFLPEDWDGTPRDVAVRLFHQLRARGVVLTRVNQSLHATTSLNIPTAERQAMERYALDLMAILYAIELQDPRALVWLGGGGPRPAWWVDHGDPGG